MYFVDTSTIQFFCLLHLNKKTKKKALKATFPIIGHHQGLFEFMYTLALCSK